MEPVGIGVGVVGLFGLFNTCLDVVNKYDSWKDFGSESHCLTAQFEAQKLGPQIWGEAVGVEHEMYRVSTTSFLMIHEHNRILKICF